MVLVTAMKKVAGTSSLTSLGVEMVIAECDEPVRSILRDADGTFMWGKVDGIVDGIN